MGGDLTKKLSPHGGKTSPGERRLFDSVTGVHPVLLAVSFFDNDPI